MALDDVDVATENRRQIGVHHGGVAASHQLDQRVDHVRHRDLSETDVAGQSGQRAFVGGMDEPVHQHDGDRGESLTVSGTECFDRSVLVQGHQRRAVHGDSFVHFDHPFIDHVRQGDVESEDVGPGLVPNPKRVGKPSGDHQHRRFALPFEQGVGCHRRPHLHGVDSLIGNRLARPEPQDSTNSFDCGVVVVPCILGEELERRHRTVGLSPDDVGEGPTPVDPELPAGHWSNLGEDRPAKTCQGPHSGRFWPETERCPHDLRNVP